MGDPTTAIPRASPDPALTREWSPADPDAVLRRVVPDRVQVQIILGSLLGGARLGGRARERHLLILDPRRRTEYARWKYERLGSLAAAPPHLVEDGVALRTIAHPFFDDLARYVRGDARGRVRSLRPLLAPLGLAVWMADVGRLELRPDAFVGARRYLAA